MNDTFHGNHEALVAYLYDDCDPAERDAIAAHVAHCLECADEIEALRSTRRVLAAWAPPDASLGFQMTRADERPAAAVLRPAAWWRQPLPAWAQVAAAVLIFATGLAVGGVRGGAPVTPTLATAPVPAAAAVARPAADVSPADLARLEQRLVAIERRQVRTASASSPAAAVNEEALLARVQAIVADSEDRQRRENATMQTNIATLANYVRGFDLQRRVDLREVEDRLGRIQGATGVELQQQRDALSYFVRTSLSGGAAR